MKLQILIFAFALAAINANTQNVVWLVRNVGRSSGWNLAGNTGTTAVNFLGIIDNKPLRLRLNNIPSGELNANSRNFLVGDSSGLSNTTGLYNTALGSRALAFNSTANANTAMGVNGLYKNTTGQWNTALGANALHDNTTGYENTAVGTQALFYNTTGLLQHSPWREHAFAKHGRFL